MTLFIISYQEHNIFITSYTISINLFQLRPPALTYRVAHEYFENNLSDQADLYTFVDGPDGGFHDRTIHQDDLTLSFDTETDGL